MSSNHHLLTNEAHRIPKCNIPGLHTAYIPKRQPIINGDSGVGVGQEGGRGGRRGGGGGI